MKCTTGRCTTHAAWRVSVPLDPWPLQYACEIHLGGTVHRLGGDCRVVLLVPGTPTPNARNYLPGGHGLRVEADPTVPPGKVVLVTDKTTMTLDAPDLAAATAPSDRAAPAGFCPRTSPSEGWPCILADTRQAHVAGHETAYVSGRRSSWPTSDADHERWSG